MSDENTRKYLQARSVRLFSLRRAEMMNTPNAMNANLPRSPRRTSARQGFTLIEILVALGIFSILLTIILVPLNMGVNMTRIGSARTDTQQSAQALMNRIVTDLRGATYVFPNEPMPGITDKAPYTNNVTTGPPSGTIGYPYFRASAGTENVCGGTKPLPFSNTARIDFLRPTTPGDSPHSITSYFAARANVSRPWYENTPEAYDAELNPIVLYAAQIPFERTDPNGSDFLVSGRHNALVGNNRLPDTAQCTASGADINQGARWLMHNGAGEPELARVSGQNADPLNPGLQDDLSPAAGTPATDPASNIRVTPLGVGLYAPDADKPADNTNLASNQRGFTPSTSFICEDTNSNGIIDRVTVTLVVGKYDGAGAENRAQSVRLTQTVDLPNVESRFGNAR